jgi:hypothetical protein
MRLAAIALLLTAIVAGCGSSDESAAPPPMIATTSEMPPTTSMRETAPSISGESLTGESIALGDFRGRPVLINVWSSW